MSDPDPIALPGAEPVPDLEAVARHRGQLLRLLDPAHIVEVAQATLEAASGELWVRLERLVGLHGRDRARRSPLALRTLLLAFADGRLGALEDLRVRLPLAADQALGTDAYKYRGFFQDAPVGGLHGRSSNPSRWDVHHLWHATQGFVWRGGMARGTLYAGARLDEAACEAHWYWLEPMLAPRCERHRRIELEPMSWRVWPDCPSCDHSGERAPAEEARTLARGGLRFWDEEVAGVDLTLQTHVVTPAFFAPEVDNWREAWHYAIHHERRLRSRPLKRWIEACLVEGVDYETSPERYRDRGALRLSRLLLGRLEVDERRARLCQARRILQDVAARLLQAAHTGPLAEGAVEPVVAALAELTPLALAAGPAPAGDLERGRRLAWEGILAAASDPRAEDALALGYDLRELLGEPPSGRRRGLAALLAGDGLLLTALDRSLRCALPRTSLALSGRRGDPLALARAVAARPALRLGRGAPEAIAVEALAGEPALAELARYENLLAAPATADPGLREDLFAIEVAAEDLEERTLVRLNPTLRHAAFEHDVVALQRGEPVKRPTQVWTGTFLGRPLLEVADELAPLAPALRRARAVAELLATDGALAGRKDLLLDLLRRHLLVAVRAEEG